MKCHIQEKSNTEQISKISLYLYSSRYTEKSFLQMANFLQLAGCDVYLHCHIFVKGLGKTNINYPGSSHVSLPIFRSYCFTNFIGFNNVEVFIVLPHV